MPLHAAGVGRLRSPIGTEDRPSLVAARVARHAVVATRELRDAGVTAKQIHHLAAAGFLHPLHRGVWAVGRPDISFVGACRAATLACGPKSAVNDVAAARVHRFRAWNGPVHVAAPRSREPRAGIVVHRPRRLPEADVIRRHGFRVTSVARTLLDLSAHEKADRVNGWIHEAVVQRVFVRAEAFAVLERHPHHPGARTLGAALSLEFAPTRSGLEEAFRDIAREAGLPRPLVNSEQWSGESDEEVDFCWPALGLIVETDGDRFHATRWRRRRDAAKDERFRAQGWRVWRVPELAIELQRAQVAAELAARGRSSVPAGDRRRPTPVGGSGATA